MTTSLLADLTNAWLHQRTGFALLRGNGPDRRVGIRDGGAVDAQDLGWVRELTTEREGRMEAGRVDGRGDRVALGQALLDAWRGDVDRCVGTLDYEALVVLMSEPDELVAVGQPRLAEFLSRGPYAVGALVMPGIATVRDLRALRRLGLIAVPEYQVQNGSAEPAVPEEDDAQSEDEGEGELLLGEEDMQEPSSDRSPPEPGRLLGAQPHPEPEDESPSSWGQADTPVPKADENSPVDSLGEPDTEDSGAFILSGAGDDGEFRRAAPDRRNGQLRAGRAPVRPRRSERDLC